MAPNFSPPNYPRAVFQGGLCAGAWALTNVISPACGAFKFGRKKLFSEKIFFRPKTAGANGGKFSGITGGRSYTVPTAIGQEGIAIVRLRFAVGSTGNWGLPPPPKLSQIFNIFKCPPKIRGVVGEGCPLEGILTPKVRRG